MTDLAGDKLLPYGARLHELSIASGIWASVKKAAAEHGAGRVKSIKLEIGALQMIEEDQLTFWIQTLAERDGSPGIELKITTVPDGLQMRVVSAEVDLSTPQPKGDEGTSQ